MDSVEKIIDQAEKSCRLSGSRLTDKRKQVLSSLLKSGKALSAYELIDHYKSDFGDTLPATSMYRILDFLQKEHLVHKLNLANKYIACSHTSCGHEHTVSQFLICTQCQKVTEILVKKETISELLENIKNCGFQLRGQQIEMTCICKNCLAKAA